MYDLLSSEDSTEPSVSFDFTGFVCQYTSVDSLMLTRISVGVNLEEGKERTYIYI